MCRGCTWWWGAVLLVTDVWKGEVGGGGGYRPAVGDVGLGV